METIREFIKLLEQKGDIAHVTKPVSGEGVAALIWELNERKGPALWCDNVNGSRVPLVANLFGSFSRVALALGLPDDAPPKQIRNHYADIMENNSKWLAPEIVKTGPCKEVIRTGDDIDLFHFPIFKWAPGDGGPYITLNGTVSKDPETGQKRRHVPGARDQQEYDGHHGALHAGYRYPSRPRQSTRRRITSKSPY